MLIHQKISTLLFFMVFTILTCGCVSNMPLDKKAQIDLKKESIILMSLKISNQYKPSYQPYVQSILIDDSKKALEILQEKNKPNTDHLAFEENTVVRPSSTITFYPDEAYEKCANQYNKYLLSFELPPGEYKVDRVKGGSGIFPIKGQFNFPINEKFTVPSNSIIYIGKLEMINQIRKSGERRSGSVIPLIDQAVTGFSGGTFKLSVSDNYNMDIEQFKKKYPFMQDYTIVNDSTVLNEK